MNDEQLKYFKEILEVQLERLLSQSGFTVSEMVAQTAHEIEYLDQVSVHTDQVLKLRIKSRESNLIKKILNALERIENQTFGICETCEEEIAVRRLMARPVATKCILCKTEEERLERLAADKIVGEANQMNKTDPNAVFAPLENTQPAPNAAKDVTDDTLSIVIDAINSSISGMIVTDLTGVIRYANPSFCRMFEYSLETITGKDAATLFFTDEIRTFSDVIAISDLSQDFSQEFVVERPSGERMTVEVSASNVKTASGKTIGRMASFIDITHRKTMENDREQLIKKLQHALDTIKVLKGIIPICASCKRIRDDKGDWNTLETYLKEHSEAIFSHGICPDCSEKLYSGYRRKTN